ncbi:phospholipase D family protein [Chromobacterium amazonense]|uniref:phospholipase D family nuclease n=1 Tax=Chromobacterium amazonense TaxID=1382803 RepID=UPI003F7A5FBC
MRKIMWCGTLAICSGLGVAAQSSPEVMRVVNAWLTPLPAAQAFASSATFTQCFVPDGASCEALLIQAIDRTEKELLVQAYSFTSAPIAQAVARAHQRGVDVRVILDKSQRSEKYSSATYLKNAGVPVFIDYRPAIAHNKVMIFDQKAVFNGSFNFSKSAQQRNAENGVIIANDPQYVGGFVDNWIARFNQSTPN